MSNALSYLAYCKHVMNWTQTHIATLRNDPQEAEIPSHKLLIRAGLLQKLSGGLYTFMPLGLRALRKVERVVREEMDRAGAVEVLMPAMHPRELWETAGRYDLLKDVMFRITDRQNRDMVLGPTHEEVITELVSRDFTSYRQLPKTFYQIQTKFRDEIRPRFGLMRAKEFIMKDAYSFDLNWDSADASYQAMYDAYVRIFDRCGLRTRVVEADSGAMGGSASHEFMVIADAGEDGIAECDSCDYAANLERAEIRHPDRPVSSPDGPAESVATPDQKTIEEVAGFLNLPSASMVKTLIYVADDNVVAASLPGDRELCEQKLQRALGCSTLEPADDDTILKATGAPTGFIGPSGLTIPMLGDVSLQNATDCVIGGNAVDQHIRNVSIEHDTDLSDFHDLVLARDGDGCPRCDGGKLRIARGIEVGHVFKLGTKYSDAFDATYLDAEGESHTMVMGCYGIGVTRTLQALIEQNHDDSGILWSSTIAPYQVDLVLIKPDDVASREAADRLITELEQHGIDVICDDRNERPGVKFKDADLIGFPVRVVISPRSLESGEIEIKARRGDDVQMAPIDTACDAIRELLA